MGSFVSSARFGNRAVAWSRAPVTVSDQRDPQKKVQGPSGKELLGLGLAIAVAFLIPLFAGIAIDVWLHTSPLGAVIGLAAGVAAAAVTVAQRFKPYL